MSEHEEQVKLFEFLKAHSPTKPVLRKIYAIPNGGHRHIATAVKLKREGVKRGVLDIHLPVAKKGYHGLWVEMKYNKGRVSKHQKKWKKWLEEEGHKVVVCWTWEAAAKEIFKYLGIKNPL